MGWGVPATMDQGLNPWLSGLRRGDAVALPLAEKTSDT